jgi:hypothetical protein
MINRLESNELMLIMSVYRYGPASRRRSIPTQPLQTPWRFADMGPCRQGERVRPSGPLSLGYADPVEVVAGRSGARGRSDVEGSHVRGSGAVCRR